MLTSLPIHSREIMLIKIHALTILLSAALAAKVSAKGDDTRASDVKAPSPSFVLPSKANGNGAVVISGDLMQWHKVTLTLDGPYAQEKDKAPNPFTDHNLTVTFTHQSGTPSYRIPGYFAADGNSGESSAESGNQWRAHLSPDKEGTWNYKISFTSGHHAALNGGGTKIKPFDGISGSFKVAKTDKSGRDFRGKGRLQYVGKHHLQFAGSQEFFLKFGPDSPENFLGSSGIDGTISAKKGRRLKTWNAHVKDWRAGDPTWKSGMGKGMIGALNYLAGKGCNAFSFLTYNAGGDGDDVWPFIERNAKFHYDCSKLDQWTIVLDHANEQGIYCHFKLQETENDDNRAGDKKQDSPISTALDGGKLGPERKLYLREMVARFGHLLALNWNFGEENTQSSEEQREMIQYLAKLDAYQHHRVLHTYPGQQNQVYTPLLGTQSALTGASIQIGYDNSHRSTLEWIQKSAKSAKPWVVSHDEEGSANIGVPPDIGYEGFDGEINKGKSKSGKNIPSTDDIRKFTLWGNLMAGGAGVEYYFGYQLPQNDLNCQDYRSRDKSWDYCRIAVDFFHANKIPFWEMKNANASIGNNKNDNSQYCLAKEGEVYLVYLPNGGRTEIDLSRTDGSYKLQWFNPRAGGMLQDGGTITANSKTPLRAPDANDWLAVIRKNP